MSTPAVLGYVVDDLGEFVVAADTVYLPDGAETLMRRNVLDSIGCAIAALDGETVRAVREQVESVGGAPHATLIGGRRSSVDQATLFNSVAVRYVDLLDTYLSPGGLCHPADNFGALLSVAESAGATGDEFVLALAVAYEVQCRFSAAVPVMARGLNHALQLAISVAAGAAKLLHLTPEQTAHAIAIAAADNVSLAAVHSEPVSNWKGISPGITAQRAVYTTGLAQRGITGPRGLFEGPNGLEQLFGQRIDLHLDDPTLGVVKDTYLKKYCSLIHGQAPIETVLALAREEGIEHGGHRIGRRRGLSDRLRDRRRRKLWRQGRAPDEGTGRLQPEVPTGRGVHRWPSRARATPDRTHPPTGRARAAASHRSSARRVANGRLSAGHSGSGRGVDPRRPPLHP